MVKFRFKHLTIVLIVYCFTLFDLLAASSKWVGKYPDGPADIKLTLEEENYSEPVELFGTVKTNAGQIVGILRYDFQKPVTMDDGIHQTKMSEIIRPFVGVRIDDRIVLQKINYDLGLVLGIEVLTFKAPEKGAKSLLVKFDRIRVNKDGTYTQAETLRFSRLPDDL